MRISIAKLPGGLIAALAITAVSAEEVVVYSARNEQLIKPLFDAYTGPPWAPAPQRPPAPPPR